MKHAAERGSGAMIDIPTFTKTGSSIQKLIEGDTHTRTDGRTGRKLYKPTVRKLANKMKSVLYLGSYFPERFSTSFETINAMFKMRGLHGCEVS
jgi:hypothetical protein